MSVRLWLLLIVLTVVANIRGEEPKKPAAFEAVDVKSGLDASDVTDRARNFPCKLHRVRLFKGKTYQFDMISTEFDTFLRLENEQGTQLAQDDDSGGQLNARIRLTIPADGDYRIIATTFAGAIGSYRLKVAQQD